MRQVEGEQFLLLVDIVKVMMGLLIQVGASHIFIHQALLCKALPFVEVPAPWHKFELLLSSSHQDA